MSKIKVNISVYFQCADSKEYFLFQVLNFGKDTDELKFIFNNPSSGTGGMYSESKNEFTGSELVRLQPEITYHSKGLLHIILPQYNDRISTEYKNRQIRRAPLSEILEWSPFIRYTVVNYNLCKKPSASYKVVISANQKLFDGTPFECILFLGAKDNLTPLSKSTESTIRVPDVANGLDLLVCVYKSLYRGEMMRIRNTDIQVWSTNNIIEIVEKKRPA